MSRCNLITVERLKHLFEYDATTGKFSRRRTVRGVKPEWVGIPIGTVTKAGYVVITIDARQYFAHRLAWFYVNGEWPDLLIDHIDGNKQNNAIANLRLATNEINNQNRKVPQKRNKAGLLGVFPFRKKWGAKLVTNGNFVWLGVHDSPESAHAAYVKAKRIYHEGNTL